MQGWATACNSINSIEEYSKVFKSWQQYVEEVSMN